MMTSYYMVLSPIASQDDDGDTVFFTKLDLDFIYGLCQYLDFICKRVTIMPVFGFATNGFAPTTD